jgi:hypothetical protein
MMTTMRQSVSSNKHAHTHAQPDEVTSLMCFTPVERAELQCPELQQLATREREAITGRLGEGERERVVVVALAPPRILSGWMPC